MDKSTTPPNAWWRLYGDHELDHLLQEAFAANTDIRAAEANLSSARALLIATRAGRYPTTSAKFEGVYGRDPATDEILELDGHKPQTTWLYDDVFDVSYELDLFGHVRRSIEASRADAEAAAAARDALRITVAAETARAYGQICALGEQLAVARESYALASREVDITAQRRDAGAGTRFDVVRAQAFAAQTRAAIAPLDGQRRSALFQLALLLGRTPSRAPEETLSCIAPPRLGGSIPVGDGAALLSRRPDVRQAERRLAAATARIGVATADLYPRITLKGFYGGAATTIPDLGTNAGLAWGVGPSISWAFPNQAAPRARLRQAKASAASALATFDSTVLLALKETEQALATYSAEIEHHAALLEAQTRAHEAYDLAGGELAAGSISPLDLLAAEQTRLTADAALAASDGAIVQDQIAVFKALGGGWQS